jgi:predicted O-methyltransferase YrrM
MKNILATLALLIAPIIMLAQESALDIKVRAFLAKHRGEWHDLNVPYQDGETLYNLIIQNHYTSALEIGTSTGHSTIWLAWAMSKTGGKVITLELSESRRRQALKNLEEAGLLAFVDSRLGDAHELVSQVSGPFDFVFSDADKDWYTQYFKDVTSRLLSGGCYTIYNVIDRVASKEYLEFVMGNPDFTSTIDRGSRAGILISYKKK